MTPAVDLLRKHAVEHTLHEYTHDPKAESYGLEAAEKLGVDAASVFKTLVVQLDKKALAVAILPVSKQLSLKAIAKACKAKKAEMAAPNLVQRSTGYVLGGVSPLGQKNRLLTVIDSSAEKVDTMLVSAGRRGLEIEIAPAQLRELLAASNNAITA